MQVGRVGGETLSRVPPPKAETRVEGTLQGAETLKKPKATASGRPPTNMVQ